jgi:hypothetical protein
MANSIPRMPPGEQYHLGVKARVAAWGLATESTLYSHGPRYRAPTSTRTSPALILGLQQRRRAIEHLTTEYAALSTYTIVCSRKTRYLLYQGEEESSRQYMPLGNKGNHQKIITTNCSCHCPYSLSPISCEQHYSTLFTQKDDQILPIQYRRYSTPFKA